jgi:hypothetical protein
MKIKSKWLVVGAAVVAAAALLFHAPLLRCLAGLLIDDEPIGDYQYVGILGWDGRPDADWCFDAAVQLCRRRPSCDVLLIDSPRSRVAELGILPSFGALGRRELTARGLPPSAVSIIPSDGRDGWATARTLRAWLAERPKTAIVLLCGRFGSAHLRYALDAVLDPSQAARVRIRALPDRRCDETNWWTSREGIKVFGIAWLRQLHGWSTGGDQLPPPYCSVENYESKVRKVLGQATP